MNRNLVTIVTLGIALWVAGPARAQGTSTYHTGAESADHGHTDLRADPRGNGDSDGTNN
jgi:hypothetical protein